MRAPCRRSSPWTRVTSMRSNASPSRTDIAAATPAACPVTAQHILLRTAACDTLSPADAAPGDPALLADGVHDEVAVRVDLPRVADADGHPEVAELRVLASGMERRRASIASIAWRRPSISPAVRSSASVPSQRSRCTRFRYVRNPDVCRRRQLPLLHARHDRTTRGLAWIVLAAVGSPYSGPS
jgi:hypothetical protein